MKNKMELETDTETNMHDSAGEEDDRRQQLIAMGVDPERWETFWLLSAHHEAANMQGDWFAHPPCACLTLRYPDPELEFYTAPSNQPPCQDCGRVGYRFRLRTLW